MSDWRLWKLHYTTECKRWIDTWVDYWQCSIPPTLERLQGWIDKHYPSWGIAYDFSAIDVTGMDKDTVAKITERIYKDV